ncbi:MAG: LssY C-terminal domain-containing protein [Xanthomonadales bacterium]|nr:LssY C-terminal domain-containing protein [Xanthomonadales bacterium]
MFPNRIGKLCVLVVAVLLILASCSTASYKPAPLNVDSLRQRAKVQTFEPLTVKAAVPGAEESKALFDVPLYSRGIQPVWLEITNRGDERVRFALVSVDPDYFSPLEVSYTSRSGFSREARAAMDERFHGSAITRFVQPGETTSGFVFTHLHPGTKSFNVDLFGAESRQNFAFFIQVPGFLPDHAEVDFDQLYTGDEIRNLGIGEFRAALKDVPQNSMDDRGKPNGLPVNVVIVANGLDLLRALLRGGWYESTVATSGKAASGRAGYYMYGRKPDAVFRIQRNKSEDRNEIRLWLSPMRVEGEEVWLAQVNNFVGQRSYIEQVFYGAHLDPDVDDARGFLLQNIWYSQGLQSYAWSQTGESVSFDQPGSDFNGNPFFTDGFRAVLWFSGEPYSLLDTTQTYWDEAAAE